MYQSKNKTLKLEQNVVIVIFTTYTLYIFVHATMRDAQSIRT